MHKWRKLKGGDEAGMLSTVASWDPSKVGPGADRGCSCGRECGRDRGCSCSCCLQVCLRALVGRLHVCVCMRACVLVGGGGPVVPVNSSPLHASFMPPPATPPHSPPPRLPALPCSDTEPGFHAAAPFA